MTERTRETMSTEMNNMVDAAIKKVFPDTERPLVYYAAYKTDGNGVPINNLNDVAIEGNVQVIDYRNPSAQYPTESKDYIGPVLTNPTWLDLAVQAECMILATGDTDHRFLEDYEKVDGFDGYDPLVVNLWMGS